MHPDLTPLHSLEALDQALLASHEHPLLIFKHSHSCGTSAEALDEVLEHLAGPRGDARYAIVTVQTARDVSNAIVARLGARHETPQALLVRDGAVVWSASHFRVRAAELERAISQHGAPPSDARSPAPPPTPTTTPTEN